MKAFPFATVGFDLDGTLVDTGGDIAAAVDYTLTSAGRPTLGEERVRPMIGGGSRHMFAQALDATGGCTDTELDMLMPTLLAFYEEHIAVKSRAFVGCVGMLDALATKGVRLAVVTNKLERLAVALLRELGLLDRFATVIGGDTLGEGRGKPEPDLIELMVDRCGGGRAAFVGDSVYDVMAARAAGVPVVLCAFDRSEQPVDLLGADAAIAGWGELVAVLERLGGEGA